MANAKDTSGSSDAFDDIILDPEGASEGLSQKSQGYEDSPEDSISENTSEKGGEKKADLETFDNVGEQLKPLEDKEDNASDDKKDDEKTSKEEDKSKEEDEKDKSSDEEKDSGKEGEEGDKKEKEDAPKGKTLKLFQDGKRYEVPVDAEVKVKVDGKWEKVSVSDLRDNYSGQKAWSEQIGQAKAKLQEVEEKESQLSQVQQTIRSTLDEVQSGLKSALQEGGNPMEALNKIIDMVQIDSYDFNKALFNHLSEELVTLNDMDEYERKAYWLEKQTEHLQKRHESFEERLKQSQAQEERLAKVDQLRDRHGVSEDDFVSAYNELTELGKEVTPEQVVQYAANLPFVQTAEELLTPYEDQLSDSEFQEMMAKVANTLKTNKDVTKDDLSVYLAEHFEVEDVINAANGKAEKLGAGKDQSREKHVPSQKDLYSQATYESFDDFDV